jgi:hypothetical protein
MTMTARVELLRVLEFPTAPVEELLRSAARLLRGLVSQRELSRIRDEARQIIALFNAIQLPKIDPDVMLAECVGCSEATCGHSERVLTTAKHFLAMAEKLEGYVNFELKLSRLDKGIAAELNEARLGAETRLVSCARDMITYHNNLSVANAVAITQREWAPVIERLASR